MSTTSGQAKKGGKKRKTRVKKSILADLNTREINWRDWGPQFVALLPLLDSKTVAADFARLRESVQKYTGRAFDGTVASWREVSAVDATSIAMVRHENPQFFAGSNTALFKLVGFATPTVDDPAHIETLTPKDVAGLVLAYKRLEGPRTVDSTKVKALWLIALTEDDDLSATCEAYLGGDSTLGGYVRASWSGQIAVRDLQPNVDWAAEFISWGLENTPCVVSPYEPPERPPWPVEPLEPIAETLDVIIENVLNVSNGPAADRAVADTLTGLVARLRDLSRLVRHQAARNDGMAAEIVLGCSADTAVQMKCLLFRDDRAMYEQFQERSQGSEKGLLDDLRERLVLSGAKPEFADKLVDAEYADLFSRAGRWPELFDVVYGPWSDISTTKMFKELPDTDESFLAFATWIRSSDTVHGAWRSIEKYQLTKCANPFHVGHHHAIAGGPVGGGITHVLSSMLIPIDALGGYADRYPQLDGLAEAVERQRIALHQWVASHQRNDGSFRWHDSSADED